MRIRTTLQQRETIRILRSRFGEQKYLVFPVAGWYRRHYLDFVAIPKKSPQQFVLVHAVRSGYVSVRPHCVSTMHGSVRTLIKSGKIPLVARWSARQLRKTPSGSVLWYDYVPPSAIKEYYGITGIRLTQHSQ